MQSRAARFLAALSALVLSAPVPLAQEETPEPISGGERWGAEYFPNVPLVTQDGRTVHFFDDLIRDKVVVVNFIYTSCPDACPLETAKLVEVASILGERVGQDVFLYSISIDPERDTPEVLKDYAERYQVGPGWLFLTGEAADIKLVRQKLGMIRTGEEALSEHTLSLMIGNQATGMWMKRSPMENPYLLATQIGSWLHGWKNPPKPGQSYEHAPKLRSISRGEDLYRTRCATCHLIGAEDGLTRQGPNLLGVTERRERTWLARWLAEPDVMLAEKDPIAIELFEANRKLPMPNMRLNPREVEWLLEFMDSESQRFLGEQRLADEDWATEDTTAEEERAPCCEKLDELVFDSESVADLGPGTGPARGPKWGPEAWPASPGSGTRAARQPAAQARSDRGRISLAFATSAGLCLGLAFALGILSFAARGRRS